MLAFMKIQPPRRTISAGDVPAFYRRLRWHALFGVFLAYLTYYIVRNNFTFSTPFLLKEFNWNKADIGLLSGAMLIAYGISKGVMSSLADKSDVRRFVAVGLIMSAFVNLMLGFSSGFWVFFCLVILNGAFQGMGVGPAFITISHWFPRSQRGSAGAVWNISHNVGGGLVAPLVGGVLVYLGTQHWQAASYWVPAAIAVCVAGVVLMLGASIPTSEGLPPLEKILKKEGADELVASSASNDAQGLSPWGIFVRYVLPNKTVWLVSFVDVFVYAIRFGVITWLPIYLLKEKGFSKEDMGLAFAVFEWAAIPSTLLAGLLSDRLFKGRRMPMVIVAMSLIFVAMLVYWQGTTVMTVSLAAAVVGCLIYIPQFLASVQTIEIVPAFAVGSATGLRGLLSYLLGASAGTALFGVLAERYGWHAGFYLILTAIVLCALCAFLTHLSVLGLERRKNAIWADRVAQTAEAAV